MLFASKISTHLHNLPTSITIGNAQIPFKQSVKKLGFALDSHLAMNAQVSNIALTCYFELHHLASIHRFLTSTTTATLVSSFVLSRIFYYGTLLFCSTLNVTSHLQRMQNYALTNYADTVSQSVEHRHHKPMTWVRILESVRFLVCCVLSSLLPL